MARVYDTNFVASIVLLGIAICLVGGRFASYPRKIRREWTSIYRLYNQIEKWFMIGALVAFGLFCAIIWLARMDVQNQVGEGSKYSEGYLWYRETRRLDHSFGIVGYAVSFMVCRTVMITMYQRIWDPRVQDTKAKKYLGQGYVLLNCAWMFTAIIWEIRRCSPYKKAFEDSEPGRCVSQNIFVTVIEVWGFLLNVVLLVLPFHYIHVKGFATGERIQLFALSLIGVFVCAVGMVQLAFAWGDQDPVDQMNGYLLWRTIQLTFAFVCCCVPPMKSFLPGESAPRVHGIPLEVQNK